MEALHSKKFLYDEKKAIEVMLYVAQKVTDKYALLKILYFADRLHLEKYGRLICGDRYARLDFGMVPSDSYDLLKSSRINSDINASKKIVKPLRIPDLRFLSKSDIKCLDQSIEENKNLTFDELKAKGHDKTYDASESHIVSLSDFTIGYDNPDKIRKHLETIVF